MKMNIDHLRNKNGHVGNNCYDISLTAGVNDQGQAYTYGKEPDVSRQNSVKDELYYDGYPKLP